MRALLTDQRLWATVADLRSSTKKFEKNPMLVSLAKDFDEQRSEKIVCPVCRSESHAPSKASSEFKGKIYNFYACQACQSLVSVPPPEVDYTEHTSDEISLRAYVELNCSIDSLALNVMRVVGPKRGGRLIDVGCGFGFSCDIAKRIAGWEVVGVEPSYYGELGAKMLGLNVVREYVDENHPVAQSKYDIFHASEVIEHVDDPLKFASLAKKLLAPGGVAVMTTPLAEELESDVGDAIRYAMLSPSAHGFLFTRDAIIKLFHEAGFTHVVDEMRGTSIAIYASDQPITLHEVDTSRLTLDYAREVLKDYPEPNSLRDGLIYRAFAVCVSQGRFKEATEFLSNVEALLQYHAGRHDTYVDFMNSYRAFIGPLYFFHGTYCMNHLGDFARARRSFVIGYELCAEKFALNPNMSAVDADVVWTCMLFAGISSFYAGDHSTAQFYYDRILATPEDAPMPVPLHIRRQTEDQKKLLRPFG
jgi:SAM-dependent methyltransferase